MVPTISIRKSLTLDVWSKEQVEVRYFYRKSHSPSLTVFCFHEDHEEEWKYQIK